MCKVYNENIENETQQAALLELLQTSEEETDVELDLETARCFARCEADERTRDDDMRFYAFEGKVYSAVDGLGSVALLNCTEEEMIAKLDAIFA